jgi:hypothetical protein
VALKAADKPKRFHFFFFNGAAAHIGPWPSLYEVP